jgi:hypothetical protein
MQKGAGYSVRTYNLPRNLAETGNDVSVVLPKDKLSYESIGALFVSFIRRVLKKPVVINSHDVFQALRLKHTGVLKRMLETFFFKTGF